MLKEDVINSRVEGVIYGSEIVKQDVQWEGEVPIATVEIRVCLSEGGSCKSGKSILSALDLDQKIEPPNVPPQKFDETVGKQSTTMPKIQGIIYDSSKTVTGMVLNLQGRIFERVILPVVITTGEQLCFHVKLFLPGERAREYCFSPWHLRSSEAFSCKQ
jgi:hypothetical protein